MTDGTFFSPSYIGDLERMVWLRRSIERFHDAPTRHVIAVPKHDLGAFKNALGCSTELEFICQEDLVEPGFYPDWRYLLVKKLTPQQVWRFQTHAGKPGWIVQQIVKLASNRLIENGPIIFLDSDIVFYRPFSLKRDIGLKDGVRILVRITPKEESAKHRKHIANARRFFDLPDGPTETTYMATPAIWYPDWLRLLQNHIEQIKRKPWQKALLEADFSISEYTLYGVFIDEVLKPENLTVRDTPFNLIAWDRASFDALKSAVLSGQPLPSNRLTLCLQSNIQIPVSDYEDMLRAILNQSQPENAL